MSRALRLFVALAAMALAPGRSMAQEVLRITSPIDGTIVHPGETISVDVSTSGVVLNGAVIAAQDPIKDSQILYAPPYRFSITIPSTIGRMGRYTLVAEGSSVTAEIPFSCNLGRRRTSRPSQGHQHGPNAN